MNVTSDAERKRFGPLQSTLGFTGVIMEQQISSAPSRGLNGKAFEDHTVWPLRCLEGFV